MVYPLANDNYEADPHDLVYFAVYRPANYIYESDPQLVHHLIVIAGVHISGPSGD